MLEFLQSFPDNDAIVLIKKDHDIIRDLFARFNSSEKPPEQKRLSDEALRVLKIHTLLEEEVFYPVIRGRLEKHMMTEADEEHHETKLLMAEIGQMTGSEDHWWAKIHVLGENITHHFKDEEEKMFPKARRLDVDFAQIGDLMLKRKWQMENQGIPESAEDWLIKRHGIADSSAEAAKLDKPALQ